MPLAGPHLSEGSRSPESPWASNHGVCVPTPNRGRPVVTDESTMALAQVCPSNSRRAPGSRGLGIESASQPASVAAVIGISKCTEIHCRDAAFLSVMSVVLRGIGCMAPGHDERHPRLASCSVASRWRQRQHRAGRVFTPENDARLTPPGKRNGPSIGKRNVRDARPSRLHLAVA